MASTSRINQRYRASHTDLERALLEQEGMPTNGIQRPIKVMGYFGKWNLLTHNPVETYAEALRHVINQPPITATSATDSMTYKKHRYGDRKR